MTTRLKFCCALVALASLPVFLGGCQQKVGEPTGVAVEAVVGDHDADSEGRATVMPAFFNGSPIMINVVEFPPGAEAAFLAQRDRDAGTTNQIFVGDDLDREQPFPPVIDAIQGDGFNPRWRQITIVPSTFCTTAPPFSCTSATAIEAAAKAGTISLDVSNEFYRCSVVGPGPKPQ